MLTIATQVLSIQQLTVILAGLRHLTSNGVVLLGLCPLPQKQQEIVEPQGMYIFNTFIKDLLQTQLINKELLTLQHSLEIQSQQE
jgi:hypothetical protein